MNQPVPLRRRRVKPLGRAGRADRAGRRGYTIFLLLIVIGVVSVLAASIYTLISEGSAVAAKHAESSTAYYLAEAGVHKALHDLKLVFRHELVTPRSPAKDQVQKVDEELLELLDLERARRWSRAYDVRDDDLARGGVISIRMDLLDVTQTPFGAYLDPLEQVPPFLEAFHLKRGQDAERQVGVAALGGWRGKLRISVTGQYRRSRRTIETWRTIQVVDVTPPAADYTLFVEGEEREYLKEGRFVLSNLTVPPEVRAEIYNLARAVNEVVRLQEAGEAPPESLGAVASLDQKMDRLLAKGELPEALKVIGAISQKATDRKVRDTLDRLVLSLDPRDWGRVRTNGSLFVYLPFFATDDIINYFVDPSPMSRRRPEVGFLGHDNRLHDPFLSIYTLFEGRIYKVFNRLRPLEDGAGSAPQEVPPQRYTINTKMNYPSMRPETKPPSLLGRLREQGRQYAQRYSEQPRRFAGSPDLPIRLAGIHLCDKGVTVSGQYQGRGLIVARGEIKVYGDVQPTHEGDRLGLVSLEGSVQLAPTLQHVRLTAAVTAKHGVKGAPNQTLALKGNLVVGKLDRPAMPRSFSLDFDPNVKSHYVDNCVGVIARPLFFRREVGSPTSRRRWRFTSDQPKDEEAEEK